MGRLLREPVAQLEAIDNQTESIVLLEDQSTPERQMTENTQRTQEEVNETQWVCVCVSLTYIHVQKHNTNTPQWRPKRLELALFNAEP